MRRLFCCFAACCAFLLFTACSQNAGYSGSPVAGYDGTWTTVIYMAADNDLENEALSDLREMIAGAVSLEEAGHTVLVLFDGAADGDTHLYRVKPAARSAGQNDFSFMETGCERLSLAAGAASELNMAAPETLRELLLYADEAYPADNRALIIWGHGCGWRGYAVDEQSDQVMSLPALHEALSSLRKPLSVIAFDCCYGAMLETAYELRDDAAYFVAAERDEPAAGWNYTLFLEALSQKGAGGAGASAAERYARTVVNAFGRQYASRNGVSLTALSLSKVDAVFTVFDAFARACAGCITTRGDTAAFSAQVLSDADCFLTGDYPAYRFVDIQSLTTSVCSSALATTAVQAASALSEALTDATLVSFTGGSGVQGGLSRQPMLGVYLSTVRSGGVVDASYPQLYIRGSGVPGQCAFVRDSVGWVPQYWLQSSASLLDYLYRMPLP